MTSLYDVIITTKDKVSIIFNLQKKIKNKDNLLALILFICFLLSKFEALSEGKQQMILDFVHSITSL